MPMQYIKDNKGKTTAVIIPIEEWKELTSRHEDLIQLEQKAVATTEKKIKPSDFAGILSEDAYQSITQHIKKERDEWDRDTY